MVHRSRWAFAAVCLAAVLLSAAAPPGPPLPQDPGQHFMLTVLYDSCGSRTDLEKDWGFACLVEGAGETILFDTGGSGESLLANMQTLELDPADVDAVVLSHEHDDHIGGLSAFLERNRDVSVYVPSAYVRHVRTTVEEAGAWLVPVDGPVRICPGARSTGQVGRARTEQALALETPAGLVVITGCAHPGIVEMVRAARERHDGPVSLVMGGFHLGAARAEKLQEVRRRLEAQEVRRVAPCHCSGDRTRKLFAQWLGRRYVRSGVGTRLDTRLLGQVACLYGPAQEAEREAVRAVFHKIGARHRTLDGPELAGGEAEPCSLLVVPSGDPEQLAEEQRRQLAAVLAEGRRCVVFDERLAATLPDEVAEGVTVLPPPGEASQEAADALRRILLQRAAEQ